jgi:transcriptional regulator with XRE-family HTH domain
MKCIRLLREILGITQQTLVEESGISRVSISHFETGRVFPSRLVAKRLDDAIETIIDRRALEAAERLRYSREPEEHVTPPGSGQPPGPDAFPKQTAAVERAEGEAR